MQTECVLENRLDLRFVPLGPFVHRPVCRFCLATCANLIELFLRAAAIVGNTIRVKRGFPGLSIKYTTVVLLTLYFKKINVIIYCGPGGIIKRERIKIVFRRRNSRRYSATTRVVRVP